MSLKLFFAPGACSFVPHAMLELAGVEFEPMSVKLHKGEQRSAEYLALNPRGQVPVLVDDGEVITQIVPSCCTWTPSCPRPASCPPRAGAHPCAVHADVDEQHGAPHLHPRVHAAEVHRRRSRAEGHPGPLVQAYRELLGEIEAMAAKAAPWLAATTPGRWTPTP
jgi:glutathione S-transferase